MVNIATDKGETVQENWLELWDEKRRVKSEKGGATRNHSGMRLGGEFRKKIHNERKCSAFLLKVAPSSWKTFSNRLGTLKFPILFNF